MFRLRPAFMVFALVVPAVSASAATVGLGGGDNDPQLITDPTYQLLAAGHCLGLYPVQYQCALYDATEFALTGGITSIDFRLLDQFLNPIPFPSGITADPLSALITLSQSTLFPDGYTFRLSSTIPLVCFTCVFFSDPTGPVNPQWVSIVNVTGVPEPATLLLLGPGVALAMRRRWRGRKVNRATAAISTERQAPPASRSADC